MKIKGLQKTNHKFRTYTNLFPPPPTKKRELSSFKIAHYYAKEKGVLELINQLSYPNPSYLPSIVCPEKKKDISKQQITSIQANNRRKQKIKIK